MKIPNQPKWLDNAIFYEIYPQSFCDSNGDGIGDIDGIISKLDYIKELGCTAIWLNPCFASPFYDAGYDISDYYKVAPRYGTNEDLARLFEQVHLRGMHIILDLVPGHTSVEHEWFKKSMLAEENEYTHRYIWNDNVWEGTGMSTIRGISERNGCCVVNFFSHQPALNYGFFEPDPNKKWQMAQDSPAALATVAEMKNIMRFWLDMGCDGFRVDMAGTLVKGDVDCKGTISLWQGVRKMLDEDYPNAAMVSEWGDPNHSLLAGFHMDFLLHFGPSCYPELFRVKEPFFSSRGMGDVSEFVKKYTESYEKTERKGLICIPTGNHDMQRLASNIDGDNLKIAFAFILSMPGAPFIYYGDEIGMRHIKDIKSVEGGYERTGARSPMLWDDTKNAGFSTAAKEMLYIRQDEAADRPTVKAQMALKGSLYNEVKHLIALRKRHPALSNLGEIEFIYAEKNEYPLAYLRTSDDEKILVILNPKNEYAAFPSELAPAQAIYSIGGEAYAKDGKIHVPPCSAGFYTVKTH